MSWPQTVILDHVIYCLMLYLSVSFGNGGDLSVVESEMAGSEG